MFLQLAAGQRQRARHQLQSCDIGSDVFEQARCDLRPAHATSYARCRAEPGASRSPATVAMTGGVSRAMPESLQYGVL